MSARKTKNSFWCNMQAVHSRLQQVQEISAKRARYARAVFPCFARCWVQETWHPVRAVWGSRDAWQEIVVEGRCLDRAWIERSTHA